MKLRQKIILTHVLTIALILTGVVVYGNTVLRPRLLQDKTAEYDAYINQLCTSASLVLSNMEQNCFNLYQNVLLAEGLESHASPSKKRIQVEQELRNMCGNNSYFTSFLAVDLEGNTFFRHIGNHGPGHTAAFRLLQPAGRVGKQLQLLVSGR